MSKSDINLIVEANVPFVRGLLDPYATVKYLRPEEITPDEVRGCDGMIIRTRTRCDEGLLVRSRCKLVATATIGTDHINLDYCRRTGVTVVNSPGCNAAAVAQYVMASVLNVINRPLQSYTMAIVGVGHVGSIVERWAKAFDMRVLRYDPPRQRAEGGDDWADLDTVLREADIITFHTPLTRTGDDKTFHMVDAAFTDGLRRAPILINTARGEIFDTEAVVAAKDAGKIGPLIVDCWENEPCIDAGLLERAAIATPHIAGYSREGKIRASQTVLDAVTTFFQLPRVTIDAPLPPAPARTVSVDGVMSTFDPMPLTAALKADPSTFEQQRNTYPLRGEAPEA